MSFVYLDTETTGLDPINHEIWEIAYAEGAGEIKSAFLPMDNFSTADVQALMVGNFHRRFQAPLDDWATVDFNDDLRIALEGNTLVGANPMFDANFLRFGWWKDHAKPDPWRYRLLDIDAYAMGALGFDEPRGLHHITSALRERGFEIATPDHTAAGDVAAVRDCHVALQKMYASAWVPASTTASPS